MGIFLSFFFFFNAQYQTLLLMFREFISQCVSLDGKLLSIDAKIARYLIFQSPLQLIHVHMTKAQPMKC